MNKKTVIVTLLTMLLSGLTLSCDKGPDIDLLLIGSWRYARANSHWVHSYRHNRSWTEQERVEGKFSQIIESKEKIDGEWKVDYDKDSKKLYLVITTAVTVEGNRSWVKDQPNRFEVLEINAEKLVLSDEQGQVRTWARVRGSQSDDGTAGGNLAILNPGPLVVNLEMDRVHGNFRFLCLDLSISVENPDGLPYLAAETDPKTGAVTYHLHPVVKDTAILFFSSQTYSDTKTLEKVKELIGEFQAVLSPYFEGRLTEVKVNKVVVTVNRDSVTEFERLYAEEHGTAQPSAETPEP
ncbi:hypothetical protein JCM14469_11610 [Desulfatiferula olefinivorans]